MSAPGGVCSWGSAPGGGVSASGPGGCIPACTGTDNRMTDRCKNITLPQTSFAGGKYKERKKERKEELCRKSTQRIN